MAEMAVENRPESLGALKRPARSCPASSRTLLCSPYQGWVRLEPRATPARLGECSLGGASVIGSGILEAAIHPQLVSAMVR